MLVEIYKNEKGNQQLVSARSLHSFLEVKSRFDHWFKRRVEKYEFQENQDFIAHVQKRPTAQGNKYNQKEYAITLDMAKELSMIENNEKGREARKYFIECEKKYYTLAESVGKIEFNPALREIQDSVNKIKTLEEEIRNLQEKVAQEYGKLSFRALRVKDDILGGDIGVLQLKEYKKH